MTLKESEDFNMAKSKLVKANEKIAETVVGGYKKVEETVVGGYKKIEETVVGGYKKMEDAFVNRYLTHEGETVEEAKARLCAEQEKLRAGEQGQHGSHLAQTAGQAQEKAHVPGGRNEEGEGSENEKK